MLGTLNALSSPSNGNKGVGQPPSESPPVDSRDAAMNPVSEIALRRFIKSECSPDGLPLLIETIFERSDLTDTIRCLSKDDAQAFIDAADETLGRFDLPSRTRANCLRQLYKTCGHHKLIPRSLEVFICYDRDGGPEYSGGYADVYKRQHCGKEIAVKVIRTCSKSDLRKVFAMFCKEFVTWKTLQHPHVLPLIGVNTSGAHFVMVSEWMNNGNINEFVKENPDKNRLKLLGGVAKGLIYVHKQRMIHGDLKGANILIDQTGNALLADFGFLTIISNTASLFHSSSHAQGGTVRWMSPELLNPQQFGLDASSPTVPSDCYALGMVIYETISGKPPFHKDQLDWAVMLKVLNGELPDRGVEFTDGLWTILERCWTPRAGERPGVGDVLRCLDTYSNLSVPSSPGMDIVWKSCPVPDPGRHVGRSSGRRILSPSWPGSRDRGPRTDFR
ncbi:kinase-like domain-containing protein [Thelephora terrestris]|uniref:Kinase-like domain-containing protein n=1 Tax=Thelephora terrestris TaxID=56493 RepID=A0A9P6L6Z0_9AGAM|nr:kinase-like domain-containing protein [Thelephora terrestris]